jgi:DNA-binding transcriptional LysR family regulator
VALVPSVGGAEEGGGLALRPLADGGLTRTLFLAVRRSSSDRPALSAFVEELQLRSAP